jgi:hypothetical protein
MLGVLLTRRQQYSVAMNFDIRDVHIKLEMTISRS